MVAISGKKDELVDLGVDSNCQFIAKKCNKKWAYFFSVSIYGCIPNDQGGGLLLPSWSITESGSD